MDNDLLRAWLLIHELSDQLAHNHKLSSALQAKATSLNEQAAHCSSGFALRRIYTDISKEFFESGLERTNAQLIIENQTLLHENKQLSHLLKEYGGTMETIMSKFRNHALAAQNHELTLTRHYEALLLACESQTQYTNLTAETQTAIGLQRLAHNLRSLHRSLAGEDPESVGETADDAPFDMQTLIQSLDDEMAAGVEDDWALERECEITRLEKENEELRKLLEIDSATLDAKGITLDLDREESGRFSTFRSDVTRKRSGSTSSSSSRFAAWNFDEPPREGWSNWETNQPQQMPQQQSQFQQQVGNGPPLQRVTDLQPGVRMQQLRRPPMFTRNPVPTPPVTVGPNRNIPTSQWSQQSMLDRAWSQGGSTLDLGR